MKQKTPDPKRFDVQAFAAMGATLSSTTPLSQMRRLHDNEVDPSLLESVARTASGEEVRWMVRGEQQPRVGGQPLVWLHLAAQADVPRICQRCLQPVRLPISIDRRIRFVQGESEAARLDAEGEDDVLAIEPTIRLLELIEDELLLALPVVPRHDQCSVPGSVDTRSHDPSESAIKADNAPKRGDSPFSVLASLRSSKGERGTEG